MTYREFADSLEIGSVVSKRTEYSIRTGIVESINASKKFEVLLMHVVWNQLEDFIHTMEVVNPETVKQYELLPPATEG